MRYVDKSLEEHLSPAFYLIPPIDDYKSNVVYINNSQVDNNRLFTTLAHEGYPGHLYQTTYFNATNDGVCLPDDFSRFNSFDKAAYDEVYAKLVDGTVDPIRTFDVANADGYATSEELTSALHLVKVAVEARQ